ncbi:Terminal nucleotidyltransferase 4B (Non-canonical poly(A) RNA polymerase PAPD5) (PAP-associated domain-containing protein 5) (Terminal guanylyltransferase) (Terminal uridylyltransferase 3) (TUTase 3) (Topoisomerase-related function protein 4-2) (TRF4-2) [Durusdinium trenchii]|uniref:Polynucleotide adenylyltransferase n=1 Tax=Durusdinium trenchii TaxID=1381693 RepID=A0ABP0SLD2_9DINO
MPSNSRRRGRPVRRAGVPLAEAERVGDSASGSGAVDCSSARDAASTQKQRRAHTRSASSVSASSHSSASEAGVATAAATTAPAPAPAGTLATSVSPTATTGNAERLPGIVFKGSGAVIREAEERMLLGAPRSNLEVVARIKPGSAVFVLDPNRMRLHAGYEAASEGRENIEPDAWSTQAGKTSGNVGSPFPAQARLRRVRAAPPLSRGEFQPVLTSSFEHAQINDMETCLPLDQTQVDDLLRLVEAHHKVGETQGVGIPGPGPAKPVANEFWERRGARLLAAARAEATKQEPPAQHQTSSMTASPSPSSALTGPKLAEPPKGAPRSSPVHSVGSEEGMGELEQPNVSMIALCASANASENGSVSSESYPSSVSSTDLGASSSEALSHGCEAKRRTEGIPHDDALSNSGSSGVASEGNQSSSRTPTTASTASASPASAKGLSIVVEEENPNGVHFLDTINQGIDRFLDNVNSRMNVRQLTLGNKEEYDMSRYSGNDANMVWAKVQEVVSNLYGIAAVQIYGSFATGLWLPGQSDLDLLINFQRLCYPRPPVHPGAAPAAFSHLRHPQNPSDTLSSSPVGVTLATAPPAAPDAAQDKESTPPSLGSNSENQPIQTEVTVPAKPTLATRQSSGQLTSQQMLHAQIGVDGGSNNNSNAAPMQAQQVPVPFLVPPQQPAPTMLEPVSIDRNQQLYYLYALHSALKMQPWCRSIKLIRSSSIPVIKMTAVSMSPTGSHGAEIPVDISFRTHDHYGIQARDYILQLSEDLPGVLRPLVLVLKRMLREFGLHDVYRGGLGSYSLTVLVAFFLLRCGFVFSSAEKAPAGVSTTRSKVATSSDTEPVVPPSNGQEHAEAQLLPGGEEAQRPQGGRFSRVPVVDPDNIPPLFDRSVERDAKALAVLEKAEAVVEEATRESRNLLKRFKENDRGDKINVGALLMGFLHMFSQPSMGGLELSKLELVIDGRGSINTQAPNPGTQQPVALCIRDPVVQNRGLGAGSFNMHQVQHKFGTLRDEFMLRPAKLVEVLSLDASVEATSADAGGQDVEASTPASAPGSFGAFSQQQQQQQHQPAQPQESPAPGFIPCFPVRPMPYPTTMPSASPMAGFVVPVTSGASSVGAPRAGRRARTQSDGSHSSIATDDSVATASTQPAYLPQIPPPMSPFQYGSQFAFGVPPTMGPKMMPAPINMMPQYYAAPVMHPQHGMRPTYSEDSTQTPGYIGYSPRSAGYSPRSSGHSPRSPGQHNDWGVCRHLVVRNIPYEANDDDYKKLIKTFERFAKVVDSRRYSQNGVLHLSFANIEDARKAMEGMQNYPVLDRSIKIRFFDELMMSSQPMDMMYPPPYPYVRTPHQRVHQHHHS